MRVSSDQQNVMMSGQRGSKSYLPQQNRQTVMFSGLLRCDRNPGNERILEADIKSLLETTGWKKSDFFEKGLLTVSMCEDYKPTH
jgi:hypothetical protein